LAKASASSSFFARMTLTTGPNTSSRLMRIAAVVSANRAGRM